MAATCPVRVKDTPSTTVNMLPVAPDVEISSRALISGSMRKVPRLCQVLPMTSSVWSMEIVCSRMAGVSPLLSL